MGVIEKMSTHPKRIGRRFKTRSRWVLEDKSLPKYLQVMYDGAIAPSEVRGLIVFYTSTYVYV